MELDVSSVPLSETISRVAPALGEPGRARSTFRQAAYSGSFNGRANDKSIIPTVVANES
jgi:hypothetical protein